jgi:hypothetical protein
MTSSSTTVVSTDPGPFNGLAAPVVLSIAVAILVAVLVAAVWPRARPVLTRGALWGALSAIAIYFVVRGVAEFWIVDPSNPETYIHDWGGPSLVGVFAVHSGPGLIVVIMALYTLRRNGRLRQRATGGDAARAGAPFSDDVGQSSEDLFSDRRQANTESTR